WGGMNSVITVPPEVSPTNRAPQPSSTNAPLAIRPQALWQSIQYPYFDVPGTPGRTITGWLSPGKEGDGLPGQILFRLIFTQLAGEQTPPALVHPQTFIVRLDLGDGSVLDGKAEPMTGWDGVGNQMGLTRSRVYEFPSTRNGYDEAWIEWR